MARRRTRDLALVVAIWAVVFAPGSFDAADAEHAPATEVAGELAAAVIAPTTGDGAVVANRPSRDRSDHTPSALDLPASATTLHPTRSITERISGRSGPRPFDAPWSPAAPRGPPLV
ncbi:hypothetical protein [Actinospongicola halichondriae]|uniref:hypothetical protein n=1 Tax=Actinospongicola halichondriae TaxID=3236844 RepID=UPI003D4F2689